ncbi:hypothetical protein [Nitrosopumilus sp.]|uniref:hypothetical protein n=1 Tax=Nitrosopumilus sp. TaxID=2024843 RepID=UPI0029302E01|nr:hypothetical protein [Nitrosopumilus sp.]
MNYSILCNEILKLDSKIRFAGVFNFRGESVAEKNRDVPSLLSADEVKMLVHYTFARWRHLQNLEHRLGKVRTSVSKHEKVTLISLYLGADLLLLSVEPGHNHTKIIKKIRTMLDDGGFPSKRKKQTNKGKKVPKVKKQTTKKNVTSSSSKNTQKTRKKSAAAVKRKAATTAAKAKKKNTAAKRSKPASKAKRRATLVANKRKRELEKANNKIKSLKKAIRLAEKSAKKKKITYQQATKRASQTR